MLPIKIWDGAQQFKNAKVSFLTSFSFITPFLQCGCIFRKYQCQTEKPIIEIDLRHLNVDQREDTDEGTAEAGESEGGSEGVGTKREQVEA